ncbi:hypothetical protein ABMA28_003493 [Loxostege sticticalis]|uniref:Uncharacterized protein n=1 Tax=Loxostege sticticalis TaxID=481309 RepID=A0ABD0T0M5_LOXSC
MVDFMERHGDLSKPTREANGRLHNLQKWSELADFLNSDPTGDDRTPEKWRKRPRGPENGWRASAARPLSAIELRVLGITGTAAATGLVNVPEIGLLLNVTNLFLLLALKIPGSRSY